MLIKYSNNWVFIILKEVIEAIFYNWIQNLCLFHFFWINWLQMDHLEKFSPQLGNLSRLCYMQRIGVISIVPIFFFSSILYLSFLFIIVFPPGANVLWPSENFFLNLEESFYLRKSI